MTTDEKIAILQAYENGRKIEKIPILKPDGVSLKWIDFDTEIEEFDFSKYEYRIKPKFKIGDKVKFPYLNDVFEINGMYFNKEQDCWLYRYIDGDQEINENWLVAYNYRPFVTDIEVVEAVLKKGTLLKYNEEGGAFVTLSRIYRDEIKITDDEIRLSFDEGLHRYTFADGTPFGVKLSEEEGQ